MYKRPGFNLYEAFISCDLNDDGTISREELRRLIESRGFYVSDKEVNQLVEKLDKDRDGRISYAEVSNNGDRYDIMCYDEKQFINSYPCHRHGR